MTDKNYVDSAILAHSGGSFLPLSGGTETGAILYNRNSTRLSTNARSIQDKNYIDSSELKFLPLNGGNMTGSVNMIIHKTSGSILTVSNPSTSTISSSNAAIFSNHAINRTAVVINDSASTGGIGLQINTIGSFSTGLYCTASNSSSIALGSSTAVGIPLELQNASSNSNPTLVVLSDITPIFNITSDGLASYTDDYAARFLDHTIIDKHYVDSLCNIKKFAITNSGTKTMLAGVNTADTVLGYTPHIAGVYQVIATCFGYATNVTQANKTYITAGVYTSSVGTAQPGQAYETSLQPYTSYTTPSNRGEFNVNITCYVTLNTTDRVFFYSGLNALPTSGTFTQTSFSLQLIRLTRP
jgi:hypothetical protein